jgi:hypothetical protein
MKRTIEVRVTEFDCAREAIEFARAERGKAILLEDKPVVVGEDDCTRLAKAGVSFAYINLVHGKVMTVPVN